MLSEVTAFVLDRVRVAELSQEANLLEDVLPLLQTLFAHVGHLLDGDNLLGEDVAGVVHGAEASMADFAQILEYPFGVVVVEEVGHLRVLQTASPATEREF